MTTTEELDIKWHEYLADYFGRKLTDREVKRWVVLFKEDLKKITAGELIDAIKWARENFKRTSTYAPDYDEVVKMVRAYRSRSRPSTGYVPLTPSKARHITVKRLGGGTMKHVYEERDMAELKELLSKRPPPDEAWEIICWPLKPKQVAELKNFCDYMKIEYKRPKFALLAIEGISNNSGGR